MLGKGVIHRFEIKDILSQGTSGVVFSAVDSETGNTVALQRFFPFGPEGRGLNAEEQTAYRVAVERLTTIRHPSLRTVICGDCDPVDGMPFIAAEWVEGHTLESYLELGTIAASDAFHILGKALELCELLSGLLAEEGVWAETQLGTIVLAGDDPITGEVTFAISPLRWLGHDQSQSGLDLIAILAEELMGWRGQTIADHAGLGLGGWVNWLKRESGKVTLQEAREKLATPSTIESPIPLQNLVTHATRPIIPQRPSLPRTINKTTKTKKPKKFNGTLFTILTLVLVAGGLITWGILRQDHLAPKISKGFAEIAAEVAAEALPAPEANARSSNEVRELRELMEKGNSSPTAKAAPATARVKKEPAPAKSPEPSGKIYSPEDSSIAAQDGNEVILEGVFKQFYYSKSGATRYLQFSDNIKSAVVGILVSNPDKELSEESLRPLIGKKIRASGTLKVQQNGRCDLMIKSRSAIETVSP